MVTNLPGNFHVLKISEVGQYNENVPLQKLLHEEESTVSRHDLVNDIDGGDILENRLFWCAGNFYLALKYIVLLEK